MRFIGVKEIKNIAVGAALLGAGGGGNAYVGTLMAISAVRKHGPIKLLDPDELADDAFCVCSSHIGAPAVSAEKFPNGNELITSFKKMQAVLGKHVDATFPIEIGGMNSMLPMVVAAKANIPLVDVDAMGRAFPEIQMSTFVLAGHPITPIVMADERGNTTLLDTIDAYWAEKLGRAITVKMGASAFMTSTPLTGLDLKRDGVKHSLSFCEQIGDLITNINKFASLAEGLKKLLTLTHGYQLLKAKVVDIQHTTKDGFNYGTVKLNGLDHDSGRVGTIDFQNENIIFKVDDQIRTTAPDLISLVDSDTLVPITNEELSYGKRVYVLGLPCDAKWRTPEGIKLVGPRYFKYNVDYVPLEELISMKGGI